MAVGTVTYRYPRATAPDNLLMLAHDAVVADLEWTEVGGGKEDPTDIVHALNMDPAVYTAIGQPEVDAVLLCPVGLALSSVRFAYKDKDTITATKLYTGAVTTEATWRFTIKRPHSMGR